MSQRLWRVEGVQNLMRENDVLEVEGELRVEQAE